MTAHLRRPPRRSRSAHDTPDPLVPFRRRIQLGASPTVPAVPEDLADLDLPSLDVIRAELDREQESHERRAGQVDTKAGLLLAASGLVAFRNSQNAPLGLAAQLLAAVAGALAVWAFLPRVAGTLSPLTLRNTYIHRPEQTTKLVVLDTRLLIHADDEQQLHSKSRRLTAAVLVLGIAVATAVAASIVSYTSTGGSSDQHRPGTSQLSSIPSPSRSSVQRGP